MSAIAEALRGLRAEVSGARAALLVGLDGMVVAGAGEQASASWELLAASGAELLRRASAASLEANLEPPAELALASDSSTLLLRSVSPEYALLVVLGPGAILGRARYELRRAADRVLPELA